MFRWIAVGRAHTPKRNTVFLTHNNLVVWVYTYTVESREWFPGCFATRLEGRANLLRAASAWLGARLHREYIRIIQGVVGRSGPVECWSLGTV